MDTTNCSQGYATDQVLLYGEDFVPFSCGVNLGVYIGVFIVLTLLRGAMCTAQFSLWQSRENKLVARTGKRRSRWPILPLLSFLSFLMVGLFTILTSLNVANSSNGGSLMLLALFFLPLGITGIFISAKIINLGKKIIPLSTLKLDRGNNLSRLSGLEKATRFLKLLYGLILVTVSVSPY